MTPTDDRHTSRTLAASNRAITDMTATASSLERQVVRCGIDSICRHYQTHQWAPRIAVRAERRNDGPWTMPSPGREQRLPNLRYLATQITCRADEQNHVGTVGAR